MLFMYETNEIARGCCGILSKSSVSGVYCLTIKHNNEVNKDILGRCQFCYCAYEYVLRISRYSGFLWVVPTNTGMFLRGLKLCGKSRTRHVLLVSKRKIGSNHAFFRDIKTSIWEKTPYSVHCLVFWRFLEILLLNYL